MKKCCKIQYQKQNKNYVHQIVWWNNRRPCYRSRDRCKYTCIRNLLWGLVYDCITYVKIDQGKLARCQLSHKTQTLQMTIITWRMFINCINLKQNNIAISWLCVFWGRKQHATLPRSTYKQNLFLIIKIQLKVIYW